MAVCPRGVAAGARLGDPAKALAIKEWVKGKPVDVLDGKHVYVVEFWATWCGPCKMTIPRLTEMQAKFKERGVVFVGISDEPAETVKPFVAQMGDQMGYVVACDDERKTALGYMEAYGQAGIPMAFVVSKEGKVLWYGHPMSDLEMVLGQVLAGTYDLKTMGARLEAKAALPEYTQLAMAGDARAGELGRKITEGLKDDWAALTDFAFGIVANDRIPRRDFALAQAALDRAEKLVPQRDFRIVAVRGILVFELGKPEEGLKLGREAVALCTEPQARPMFENFVKVMENRLKAAKAGAGKATPAPGVPVQPPAPEAASKPGAPGELRANGGEANVSAPVAVPGPAKAPAAKPLVPPGTLPPGGIQKPTQN